MLSATTASASNSGITYQGRILKPDGSPLSGASAQFKMQIRTPDAGSCLMYEELQSLDMRNSKGNFSLTMNDGTGSRIDSTGLGIDRVFANRGTFTFSAATCASGTTYTPNESDGRVLVVLFKDETMPTWEPVPAQKINFVPLAFESKQIAGYTADSLLRVVNGSGDPITGLAPLSNAQYTALLALSNGSSTAYTKSGELNGVALPTMSSGEVLGWNGTAWVSTTSTPGSNSITTTMLQSGAVDGSKLASNIAISTSGTVASAITTTRDFKIYAASPSTFYVGQLAPASLAASYTLTWPLTAGASGQVLTTDGSGALTWTSASAAGITALTGDVTATGPGSAAATVASVGGVTAANVATGANFANAGTALNTASTLVKRDGSEGFAAGAVSVSSSVYRDSGSNTVTVQAPTAVSSSYVLKYPTAVASVAGQVLTSDTSGNLSWTTMTGAPTGAAGGDLSGTYPNPSVATVGTSTAANVHGAELLANAATAANTASTIVRRDASGNFTATDVTTSSVVADTLKLNNSGSVVNVVNPVGAAYTLTLPTGTGTTGQVLSTNGSGVTSWINPLSSSSAFVQGGNTFGAIANLGTNDAFDLRFRTNGATAMTVQSGGNVGIGTTAPYAKLDVSGVFNQTASGFYFGTKNEFDVAPPSATSANGYFGAFNRVTTSSSNLGTTDMYGLDNSVHIYNGTGVVRHAAGSSDIVGNYAARTLDYADGISAKVISDNAGSVINDAAGVRTSISRANGSIGTGYGLYVGNIEATNRYSIYASDSAAPSFFAGKVGIGTTLPATKLSVSGSLRVGDGGETCDASVTGAIRYNGGNLQFCAGAMPWTTLGVSGAGISSLTGDVTATGPGAAAATVAQVGGVTAANVAAGANLANASTALNTASTVVRRDASGNFAAGAVSAGSVVLRDSGSNTVTLQAPTTVASSYVMKMPTAVAAATGQVLTSDTSGNLSWTTMSGAPTGAAGGDLSGTYPNPGVALVGTSSAANVHAAELLANAATAANTVGTIVRRDGSGNFTAGDVTTTSINADSLKLNNAGSVVNVVNPIGAAYTLTLPTGTGSSGQVLSTNGTGVTSWIAPVTGSQWTTQAPGINYMGGNVGIGTTSPVAPLHINVGGASSSIPLTLTQPGLGGSSYVGIRLGRSGASQETSQISYTHNGGTNSTLNFGHWDIPSAMVVRGDGNVGIGTTAPATKLEVVGSMRVGDGGETCGASLTGAIRYNGGNLQFCNGTPPWSTLGLSGVGISSLTGDVTATGPGAAAATVATVGGVTAANVATGANLANAATAANTASTIVKRDSSGNFTANIPTVNGLILNNAGSALGIYGPIGGAWNMTLPATAGTSGQVLSTNGSGITSWITPASGSPWTTQAPGINYMGGNVGIGTTSPAARLEINSSGTPLVVSTTDNGPFNRTMAQFAPALTASNEVFWSIGKADTQGDSATIGYTHDGPNSAANRFDFSFYQKPASLSILNNGNVGIGTTAPGAKLHVAGDMTVATMAAATAADSPVYVDATGKFKKGGGNGATFVDVSGAGGQGIGAGFSTIVMATVISDVSGLYNPSTGIYTAPIAGLYQITGSYRTQDGSTAGLQFGVGVHTSNVDGPWFFWHAIQNTTDTGQRRTTYPYIRVMRLSAGEQLRMFSYADTGVTIGTAGMTILRIGE